MPIELNNDQHAGIETRDALASLGFTEDWHATTDHQPGYVFKFGSLNLTANEVMSVYFKPVFLVTGDFANSRTISSIQFEMPLQVESLDQAKAWITHGSHLTPSECSLPWLEEGSALKHLLPCEQDRILYEERPQCSVPREWMRLATSQLRAMALQAQSDDECEVTYDGAVLTFKTPLGIVPLSASGGRPWPKACRVRLASFADLPKRLVHDPVNIYVFDSGLTIGAYRIQTL